ncbi:DUF1501 domain-containing protein [Alphaproteobacteria bacterium]|nr:DUF1501 domain-containing protein [Alphaproteobacteria bacterium]
MTTLSMNRRNWLRLMGASALCLPLTTAPAWAAGAGLGKDHTLILIELEGGNDGLNTLVPFADDNYQRVRPTLGLSGNEVLQLGGDMGLHPSLTGLAKAWERGQVRLIEGVGYPNPNRSHFRSIEIWNAGLGAETKETQGWVSRLMNQSTLGLDADGIGLGGEMGPLRGPGRFTGLEEIEEFFDQAEALRTAGILGGYDDSSMDASVGMMDGSHSVRPSGGNAALDHLLSVHSNAVGTADLLERKLRQASNRDFQMPDSALGLQLSAALQLLDAGVTTPVMKVSHGGFDTHAYQAEEHAFLLQELDTAMTAFERAARDMGLWNNVTLMTYSEFGRRFHENGSEGTDHGTAAPVLLAGGKVAGGFGGARPSLEARDLVEDDMVHTTDFRSVYAGIVQDLWGLDPAQAVGGSFKAETILS